MVVELDTEDGIGHADVVPDDGRPSPHQDAGGRPRPAHEVALDHAGAEGGDGPEDGDPGALGIDDDIVADHRRRVQLDLHAVTDLVRSSVDIVNVVVLHHDASQATATVVAAEVDARGVGGADLVAA